MSCWALVPIKERAACKARLAPRFGRAARSTLARALLDHVLETLHSAAGIDHIALVSPECADLPHSVTPLQHARRGLNEDLTDALREIEVRGASRAVIVPADLPLLAPSDVGALLARLHSTPVVLSPDRRGRGTNALALTLPSPLRLAFGEGSLARHLAEARRSGASPAIVNRDGLSFDVDDIADVHVLRRHAQWRRLVERLDTEPLPA